MSTPSYPDGGTNQFRLSQMQLFNWGTFDGLHTIPVPRSGLLVLGNSGSGKSTILDANTVILVPPYKQRFNQAAQEGGASGRGDDRTLVSYVRGQWKRSTSDDGTVVKEFLRKGTTYSVIGQQYQRADGNTITLFHVAWIRGSSVATSDAKRLWIVADRAFDARELEPFATADFNKRVLRDTVPGLRLFDEFAPYAERFRGVLGIATDRALELLHKTQSTKNLGDLDPFLRRFMLDEPQAPALVETLIKDFAEVSATYAAVVAARDQIAVLRPARDTAAAVDNATREGGQLLRLTERLTAYEVRSRYHLLRAALTEATDRRSVATAIAEDSERVFTSTDQRVTTLRTERLQLDGGSIERLNQVEAEWKGRLVATQTEFAGYAQLAAAIGVPAATSAAMLRQQVVEASAANVADAARRTTEAATLLEAQFYQREVRQALDADAQELKSLEQQRTNLPVHLLTVRQRITEALGMTVADLPYLAELMQVPEEEREWQGAIERLMSGDASTLLVTTRRRAEVLAFINREHMGTLVRVRQADGGPVRGAAALGSVASKLRVKPDHPLHDWVHANLVDQYNEIRCATTMAAYDAATRAITREGLFKRGGGLHVKDDRRRITDASQWIIGYDNAAKLALYRARVREVTERLDAANREVRAITVRLTALDELMAARERLRDIRWERIDCATVVARLYEASQHLAEAKSGSPELRALDERIAAAEQERQAASDALIAARADVSVIDAAIRKHEQTLAALHATWEATSDVPAVDALVDARVAAVGRPLTLESIDAVLGDVRLAVQGEIGTLERQCMKWRNEITSALQLFARTWPAATGGLDATLPSAPEFFRILEHLESNDLPRFEEQFFNMRRTQMDQGLVDLEATLRDELAEIPARLRPVNEALQKAAFNPGTYLRLQHASRQLESVREFQEALRGTLQNIASFDREVVELRFLATRALFDRLSGKDSASERWKTVVLDAREQVTFTAQELYTADDSEANIYTDSGGLSGGQKQKLAAICLAAALRYQLSDSQGSTPTFATVVLDEAFDKADAHFTRAAMDIFVLQFGFQMIIATPNKAITTLQDYVGGAAVVHIADRNSSRVQTIVKETMEERLVDLIDARRAASATA